MVEQFRLSHDRLPDSVEELTGGHPATSTGKAQAWPVDPFTGKGMVFRKTPSGYKVFSLGLTGKEHPEIKVNQDFETGNIGTEVGEEGSASRPSGGI